MKKTLITILILGLITLLIRQHLEYSRQFKVDDFANNSEILK
jgi:hypothetical protein